MKFKRITKKKTKKQIEDQLFQSRLADFAFLYVTIYN
jgi:hypothetical protein